MTQKSVLDCLHQRRSVRRYSSRPVDSQLVFSLLEACNRTPSGFNLQPWHFIVVENLEVRRLLQKIALEQNQIIEAPLVIVFASDTNCWKKPFDRLLMMATKANRLPKEQAIKQRRLVKEHCSIGPLGIRGAIKRLIFLFNRLGRPVVTPVCSKDELQSYMKRQTMLAVSSFLIAAESVDLATCPIEGFDEDRLKRILSIPAEMGVPAMVTLGYPLEAGAYPPSQRLPLEEKLHFDLFSNHPKYPLKRS